MLTLRFPAVCHSIPCSSASSLTLHLAQAAVVLLACTACPHCMLTRQKITCRSTSARQEHLVCAGPPGNAAVGMLADPLTFLEDTQHRYGKIAGLRLGPEAVVLISDRKAARQITVEQSASFAKV